MKNKLVLFVVGCIFLGLWACMDSDETEYEVSRDPQIATFSLSNDSISGLSDVVFVIDQLNGLIYNPDSMAFGTEVDEKVLASITFTSYVSSIELYPRATQDTVFWTGSTENDSIDFTQPVDIKTVAMDGLTTKRYVAELNVHTVLPDTMEWKKLAWLPFESGTITEQKVIAYHNNFLMYSKEGNSWNVRLASFEKPAQWVSAIPDFPTTVKIGQLVVFNDMLLVPDEDGILYFSVDAKEWTAVDLDVYVESILGTLTSNLLSVVVQDAGNSYFATLTVNGDEWIVNRSPDQIPEDYPLSEQSHATYNINNTPTLLIVGGSRGGEFTPKVWNTNDGLNWEAYQSVEIPYRRGAAVIKYDDDKLYLIGGFDEDRKPSKDIFISQNRGVAWKKTEIGPLPDDFAERGFASVVIDDEQYMYIFGGKSSINGNVLNEGWKGRINRLGFAN